MNIDRKTPIRISFYSQENNDIHSWPFQGNIRLALLMHTLTGEKEELLYALDIIIRHIPQSYFVKYEKQEIINELKIIGNYFNNDTLDVKKHKHHIRFTDIIKDRINYHINLLDILYK